jgi:hypothetical protein
MTVRRGLKQSAQSKSSKPASRPEQAKAPSTRRRTRAPAADQAGEAQDLAGAHLERESTKAPSRARPIAAST